MDQLIYVSNKKPIEEARCARRARRYGLRRAECDTVAPCMHAW